MATYAIGDIQGCFSVFERLLARIDFRAQSDRLWLVGDLINRGPQSYDMLRWAYQHRSSIRAVLGNHELNVLRRAAGLSKKRKRDTCDDLLAAPDAERLLDWVAGWPFVIKDGPFLMVHAGLLPQWTSDEAVQRSQRMQEGLQSDRKSFLQRWPDHKSLADARTFTLLRLLDAEGMPQPGHKGPPDLAPAGQQPWFTHPARASDDVTVVFGHWAALGLHLAPGLVALDSGCVWGNCLSAYRLEDGAVFQAPAGASMVPGG
jgi:bis(5'-nucleosyl)-tetraphosphatase (symmetrical)